MNAVRKFREGAGHVLITGGAGFIGCNLADRLAEQGERVLIFDSMARPGVGQNLAWLEQRHAALVSAVIGDVRDNDALATAVADASAVFHFAAQVAVTSSLDAPVEDFEVNAGGTLGVLEAVRKAGNGAPVIVASTNKVYGGLQDLPLRRDESGRRYWPVGKAAAFGLSEDRPLDFHTPYGCSKGAADQYALDYARSFGVPTVVMRMSCIYGPRQMGTEDQGWVAHFAKRALADRPISIYGDGCQVRDILYVADAIEAYLAALRSIEQVKGRAFNLGGGPENAVSLLQVIGYLEELLGRSIPVELHSWRRGDQRYYVSDTRLVRRALGLPHPLPWKDGIAALVEWLVEGSGQPRRPAFSPPIQASVRELGRAEASP